MEQTKEVSLSSQDTETGLELTLPSERTIDQDKIY